MELLRSILEKPIVEITELIELIKEDIFMGYYSGEEDPFKDININSKYSSLTDELSEINNDINETFSEIAYHFNLNKFELIKYLLSWILNSKAEPVDKGLYACFLISLFLTVLYYLFSKI